MHKTKGFANLLYYIIFEKKIEKKRLHDFLNSSKHDARQLTVQELEEYWINVPKFK